MQTLQAAELKGQIDLAIITATEETHRAALKHFVTQTFIQGRRNYTFFTVPRSNGLAYNGVLLNLPDVGNQAALSATRDLIDDLDPPWIVSLGVGKALPSHRFSLGDVIIADRIANLALETRQQRGLSEFDLRATEMAREVSTFQGTLLAPRFTHAGTSFRRF
jgi:nucleoside phosphorylase